TYAGASFNGATDEEADAAARAQAESGRFEPGTPEFEAAFDRVTSNPDLTSGSKFQDNSKIYHADANYNFADLTDVAEIQVGGSFSRYSLNSFATIYTDQDGPIDYSEVGVYTQVQKRFLEEDRLKVTASLRYDKSELFDGFFSPRVSLGYTAGEDNNHNVRASFQTGFRNPTTQDLYIGLDVGRAVLVGSAPDNLNRYTRTYPISDAAQLGLSQPETVTQTGEAAYTNSYLASSVSNP